MYNKNKVINGSKMVQMSVSTMKNYLHYNFTVNVENSMSVFVLMAVLNSKYVQKKDIELKIFEKSWITIEEKHN
jgi:hypothetical protein